MSHTASLLKALCASLVVFGLSACSAPAQDAVREPLRPVLFQHDDSAETLHLLLAFSQPDVDVFATSELPGASAGLLQQNDAGHYVYDFGPETPDGDGRFDQYVITFDIRTSDGTAHSLVIDRQSPGELMEAFNTDKPDGYSVVAFSTLDFSQGDRPTSYRVTPATGELPIGLTMIPTGQDDGSELARAAQIITWLNGQGLTYAANPQRPDYISVDEELAALRGGNEGFQCADYRSVFTALAHDHGLRIRWVNLLSFAPGAGLEDATPYSHAATEVFTEESGWVYVDPWFNLGFQRDGNWLSAEGVRDTIIHHRPDLTPVAISNNRSRTGRYGLGSGHDLQTFDVRWPAIDFYAGYFGVIENFEVDVPTVETPSAG